MSSRRATSVVVRGASSSASSAARVAPMTAFSACGVRSPPVSQMVATPRAG
jgi:hypothetical protein